jgi:hypothetical protein
MLLREPPRALFTHSDYPFALGKCLLLTPVLPRRSCSTKKLKIPPLIAHGFLEVVAWSQKHVTVQLPLSLAPTHLLSVVGGEHFLSPSDFQPRKYLKQSEPDGASHTLYNRVFRTPCHYKIECTHIRGTSFGRLRPALRPGNLKIFRGPGLGKRVVDPHFREKQKQRELSMAPIFEPKAKRRKLDGADNAPESRIKSARDLHDLLQFRQRSSPDVKNGRYTDTAWLCIG